MSDIQSPTPSLQEARFRQKRIGNALSQVYAGRTSEEPPEDLLDLLAQEHRAQRATFNSSRVAVRSTMQHSRRSSSH
jgi:hypothetical protein